MRARFLAAREEVANDVEVTCVVLLLFEEVEATVAEAQLAQFDKSVVVGVASVYLVRFCPQLILKLYVALVKRATSNRRTGSLHLNEAHCLILAAGSLFVA